MRHTIHATVLCLALVSSLSACEARQDPIEAARPRPAPTTATVQQLASDGGTLSVTRIAQGLEHPWAVALLPDGGFLVTERPGRMRRVGADGAIDVPLEGVPLVWAHGQGGLMDVVLAPDFAVSNRIWFSYSEPGPDGTAGTTVATATLGETALDDVHVVYRQPKVEGPNHFGSRIAFDNEGHVFISQGERNDRPTAQRLDKLQGKLVRLNLDGSVPADNPFVGRPDARPEIWSYGHRNSQSLAFDPRTGNLWEAEHGPRGGDEINLPLPGRNYGWPITTHGINYSGLDIPEAVGETAPGIVAPHHVWEVSPALSGMAFYTGHGGSAWKDSVLLGALSGGVLIRLELDGDRIAGEERLLGEMGKRIRDVRVGADGAVYVLTDEIDGELLKLIPPRR
ncbi:PQQ-dependent sugar dehydrogenase [Montanilutibacter psychrotolerans]|uniref:PQQ-dependent sugar dehydrogenase n=1 Tax=Montanilutibacter psychrotolerans TaxID=1327343 RepID=A0A3M8SVG2_9GAMM|nr:PQQ-dependent sugar dehydrogenase [Lysobacter psychrotolerans]RNF85289.1 PQQ-dependent sugar dehydrogenase [Lysobacter psychrotolerans]